MDLVPLAKSYISGSDGVSRVVTTIDLDHTEGKKRPKRAAAIAIRRKKEAPQPGLCCVSLYPLDDRVLWKELFRVPDDAEQANQLTKSCLASQTLY